MNTSSTEITVSAQGLSRRYGTRLAVDALTLELKRGEILGFLGPNGAGKTTTMQMLTGNLAPSAGSIRICGIDLIEQPVAGKAHIGYLPEVPPLYRELTVQEYLELAARLHRVPKAQRATAVKNTLERCGVSDVSRRLIGVLSKGYQQRVGIAQAIVHSPDVVILDEPTAGLDPNQIRDIRSLIRELGQQHSVILSTHILPEVESICNRVHILHHGRSVFSDSIAALGQFHGGRVLLLGLRHPPAVSVLHDIAGIASVETLADNLFRIGFADGADPTEELTHRAAAEGWGITQITPGQTHLEDLFVQLTQNEEQYSAAKMPAAPTESNAK